MSDTIAELDALAHAKPAAAVRKAHELIETVEVDLIPSVWACCGTAYRRQERFPKALHVLHDAEKFAPNRLVAGDAKRRLSYVAGAMGSLKAAIAKVLEAQNEFLLAGDMSAVGRTLVDQGMFHYHLKELGDAIACNGRALELLVVTETRHRFSALVGFAHCFEENDPEEARRYLLLASEIKVSEPFSLKRNWVEARISARNGGEAGGALFITLMERYFENGLLLDASLAAVDAVRYTRASETPAFQEAVRTLAFALPETGVAAAAVVELWMGCFRGKMRAEVLHRVKAAVKRERVLLARAED